MIALIQPFFLELREVLILSVFKFSSSNYQIIQIQTHLIEKTYKVQYMVMPIIPLIQLENTAG